MTDLPKNSTGGGSMMSDSGVTPSCAQTTRQTTLFNQHAERFLWVLLGVFLCICCFVAYFVIKRRSKKWKKFHSVKEEFELQERPLPTKPAGNDLYDEDIYDNKTMESTRPKHQRYSSCSDNLLSVQTGVVRVPSAVSKITTTDYEILPDGSTPDAVYPEHGTTPHHQTGIDDSQFQVEYSDVGTIDDPHSQQTNIADHEQVEYEEVDVSNEAKIPISALSTPGNINNRLPSTESTSSNSARWLPNTESTSGNSTSRLLSTESTSRNSTSRLPSTESTSRNSTSRLPRTSSSSCNPDRRMPRTGCEAGNSNDHIPNMSRFHVGRTSFERIPEPGGRRSPLLCHTNSRLESTPDSDYTLATDSISETEREDCEAFEDDTEEDNLVDNVLYTAFDGGDQTEQAQVIAGRQGVAGKEHPLGVAGTEQPLGVGGTEQPLDVAVTEQPLGVGGTEQPLGVAVTEQPLGVAGTEQPLDVAVTEQPPGVVGTEQPLGVAVTEQPPSEAGTEQPLDVAVTEQPPSEAGTEQARGVAGTIQPLGVTATGQPLGLTVTEQQLGVTGTGLPLGVIGTCSQAGNGYARHLEKVYKPTEHCSPEDELGNDDVFVNCNTSNIETTEINVDNNTNGNTIFNKAVSDITLPHKEVPGMRANDESEADVTTPVGAVHHMTVPDTFPTCKESSHNIVPFMTAFDKGQDIAGTVAPNIEVSDNEESIYSCGMLVETIANEPLYVEGHVLEIV